MQKPLVVFESVSVGEGEVDLFEKPEGSYRKRDEIFEPALAFLLFQGRLQGAGTVSKENVQGRAGYVQFHSHPSSRRSHSLDAVQLDSTSP